MYIIADSRMPEEARMELEKIGNVLWLTDEQNAYPAIACHPDIFFCQVDNELIAAKNAPQNIVNQLLQNGVKVTIGAAKAGTKYPESARYNTLITKDFVIRNTKIENSVFAEFCNNREVIHVAQGYTRCNLIHLNGNAFLTSDRGIEKTLQEKKCEVLYVAPEEIILPTVNHGFIGGCCGVFEDTFYLIGSLQFHSQGEEIRRFVENCGLKIKELYHGKLWDGGGVFGVEKQ